jgi:hypothetical protein
MSSQTTMRKANELILPKSVYDGSPGAQSREMMLFIGT